METCPQRARSLRVAVGAVAAGPAVSVVRSTVLNDRFAAYVVGDDSNRLRGAAPAPPAHRPHGGFQAAQISLIVNVAELSANLYGAHKGGIPCGRH